MIKHQTGLLRNKTIGNKDDLSKESKDFYNSNIEDVLSKIQEAFDKYSTDKESVDPAKVSYLLSISPFHNVALEPSTEHNHVDELIDLMGQYLAIKTSSIREGVSTDKKFFRTKDTMSRWMADIEDYYIDLQSENPFVELEVPFLKYNSQFTEVKPTFKNVDREGKVVVAGKPTDLSSANTQQMAVSKSRPDLDKNKDGIVDKEELLSAQKKKKKKEPKEKPTTSLSEKVKKFTNPAIN